LSTPFFRKETEQKRCSKKEKKINRPSLPVPSFWRAPPTLSSPPFSSSSVCIPVVVKVVVVVAIRSVKVLSGQCFTN
jgi:hypothetical protein